jgi:hypothetical protein
VGYEKESRYKDKCSRNENAYICLWPHKTGPSENKEIRNRMKVKEMHRQREKSQMMPI